MTDVKKIAKLSMLSFSDTEIDEISTDVKDIMNYISVIKELDCDDVEPLSSVINQSLASRKDNELIQNHVTKEDLFYNAPSKEEDVNTNTVYFKVPKVIE